ncbi:MAG: hypothetical protein SOY19_04040 [Prevotella sp.]|uniref:hypothetical protein n=1 Tax=Leyella stercorea TaxID=363265 RepID=UPI00280113B9|nr:hypothetical protein [Leyella stercorea]MDY4197954.1 hypothetical protein [Prevotella sp.]
MKNLKYFVMAMFAILASVSFSACSSDDDKDGGGSTGGSAFSTLDGRTVKYKYLYVVSEVDDGDTFYGLFASTEDLFYYRQHPEKVKDNMVYSYMALDTYADELNKPQHQFDVEVHYDCNLKEGITDDEDDSDFPVASTHIWYTTPWDQDESSTETLTIKKSGNTFKVETTELTFLASEKGVDDGIDSSSRRTKGKIAFESSNLISEVLDSPEVVFVKSEKDRKFLKSLRARRR